MPSMELEMPSMELEETFLSALNATAPDMEPLIMTDPPYKRASRISIFMKKNQKTLLLSTMLLLCALLALAIGMLTYLLVVPRALALPGLDIDPLGDIPTLFELHTEYTGPSSPASDALWHAMIPKGKGFVSLSALRAADALPDAIAQLDIHNDGALCVSVFHQLHCLDMLRKGIYAAIDGKPVRMSHMAHCFDYLRQAILCAADPALEAPAMMQGHLGVDGWNDTHQCRNFDAVFNWVERFAYESSPPALNETV